jgi:aspartyl protease family protein
MESHGAYKVSIPWKHLDYTVFIREARKTMRTHLFFIRCLLALFICSSFAGAAYAGGDVLYTGLSRDKAKFKIDGRRVFLREGERAPNGLMLVSAGKDEAIVSMGGKVYAYSLRSSEPEELETTLALSRSPNGAFFVKGCINGKSTAFLVDTGATYVSMNSKEARRLGVKYKNGKKIEMSTAAKKIPAYLVTLDSVRIEGIIVKNVTAAVLPGEFPEVILLGSTFLKNTNIQQTEQRLIIMKK